LTRVPAHGMVLSWHFDPMPEQLEMKSTSEMADDEVDGPSPEATPARAESLDLPGVYLLTAQSDGQSAVPGLGIVLDRRGLTVRKPDGEVSAILEWAQLSSVGTRSRMKTPVGRMGVVLEASSPSKSHRFVIPTDDPDGLEQEIAQLVEAYRSRRAGPRRSRALLGVVAVILAAGITLAILVAVGTVKF